MRLRIRLVRLSLALLLQAVLFKLLRVQRLLGALALRLRLAFATIGTITPVAAATAAAAAIAPPTAGLFAFLLWRSRAVLAGLLRTLLLLLRLTRRALIRPPFALRTLGWLTLDLQELALLLDLSLRAFSLGAILARLLLLGRALLIPARLLVAPSVPIASRLVTPRVAIAAWLVIAPAVAVATRLAIAPSAAFAAAMILPVA